MDNIVREVSDSSFQHDVLESEKLVLVDFWAVWCPPCRAVAPTVEAIAREHADSANVLKLNVDDNPSTAREFGIRGIPTLILFSGGKEVERIVGAASKETISRMIEKYSDSQIRESRIA